jgi:hypothetical protein
MRLLLIVAQRGNVPRETLATCRRRGIHCPDMGNSESIALCALDSDDAKTPYATPQLRGPDLEKRPLRRYTNSTRVAKGAWHYLPEHHE